MCDTCAIPLHQHSEFSQLDGYGRVTEIADRLVELGLPGGALTDHGVTCGWEPFADTLLDKGLKPIFGIEAYQAAESRKLKPEGRKNDAAHLILLAKNETGRRNVRILSDLAHRTGFHKAARLDWELLEQYREGVICTTACLGSLVSQGLKPIWEPEKTDLHEPDYSALSKLHRIFDEDLFVEIHTYSDPKQHLCNHALVEAARERGIPLVYATDGHFCSSDDWLMHEVILSMQMKRGLDQDKGDYGAWNDPKRWHPNDLYIADETDIRERLSYLDQSAVDESIANSKLIFDQCDVKLPTPRLHLPVYTPTSKYEQSFDNNKQLLADLVEVGLIERYGSPLPEAVVERAMMELEQICGAFEDGRGLEDYFLIVKLICDFCDQKGIRRGIARGSAGGSIISYALRITKVDPIKYNLYFERFWNPGRKKELPDIDLDIQKSRRHEVVAMLKRVFGENRVLTIGTHTTVQPQAGIDGAGLALWGPRHGHYGDLDEIKTIIKLAIDAGQQPSWDAIWADEEIAEQLRPHREKYPEVFGIAEELYGRVSNYGTHASATIISDVDLPEHLPCRRAKGEGGEVTLVSQHEAGVTSKLGFPKFDLLGLRTLDVIDTCLEFAGNPDVDLDAIDSVVHEFPDEFWWNLENGKTLGLFQIEDGKAARSIAKRMSARTVSDVAAIVALNRPGPLRGGVVDRYFARRNDGEAVEYRHPILSDILSDTFGDWLYQESVISYFRTIGYDLVEADKIREYLGKKKVAEMAAEKPRYLERASQFMPEQIAELIWADIVDFSRYSFNSAHSFAYGITLLQTMFLKWKYPAEFYAACIDVLNQSNVQNKMDKIGAFIREARTLGLDVRAPDVNVSDQRVSVKDGVIYLGLTEVKYVSEDAADYIMACRPLTSHEDFVESLEAESKAWKKEDKGTRNPKSPKQLCTSRAVSTLLSVGAFDSIGGREGMVSRDRAALEVDGMGIALTDPDADVLAEYDELPDAPSLDVVSDVDRDEVEVIGFVEKTTRFKVRKGRFAGREMGHLVLRWSGDTARVTLFSGEWERFKFALSDDAFIKCVVRPNVKGPTVKHISLM